MFINSPALIMLTCRMSIVLNVLVETEGHSLGIALGLNVAEVKHSSTKSLCGTLAHAHDTKEQPGA